MKIGAINKYEMDNNTITITFNTDGKGDTITPEVYLEVTELPEEKSVSAVGYVLKESDGIPMKFASISGLDTAEDITKDGIYLILSSALERLDISCSGTCKLTVKQVL